MKKIYRCECGKFIAKKESGYIKINNKCKDIQTNGIKIKAICSCKKLKIIDIDKWKIIDYSKRR